MLLKTKLKSSDPLSAFQLLALCPALAITTTLSRSLAIVASFLISLTLSALLVSLLRKRIPTKLRVPVYLFVSAFSVTLVYLVMRAVFPLTVAALSVYLPVLAVSSVTVLCLETFSTVNRPGPAVLDALRTGVRFGGIMLCCGLVRELFGTGRLFADPAGGGGVRIFPAAPLSFLSHPAGALLMIAAAAALIQFVQVRREKKSGEDYETV